VSQDPHNSAAEEAEEASAPAQAEIAQQDGVDDGQQSLDFDIKLPVYDGPIDLLLDLVRKHKLDIFDLPISKVTEQYLAYLKRADEMNIDLGGEFVFML